MELLEQDREESKEEGKEALDTLNCFDFFCAICLDTTTFENSGNFSKCQRCHNMGSNFWQACFECGRGNQYCFAKDVSKQSEALCPKCFGCHWSGEPTAKESCYCVSCEQETSWHVYLCAK